MYIAFVKEPTKCLVIRLINNLAHQHNLTASFELNGGELMMINKNNDWKQDRYIQYLKQQSTSVLLKLADRKEYGKILEEELIKMENGKGRHQI